MAYTTVKKVDGQWVITRLEEPKPIAPVAVKPGPRVYWNKPEAKRRMSSTGYVVSR